MPPAAYFPLFAPTHTPPRGNLKRGPPKPPPRTGCALFAPVSPAPGAARPTVDGKKRHGP
eukprot:7685037-Lingulodinium_polyedra.AAC.1